MNAPELLTYSELSADLGVRIEVVSAWVRVLQIKPHRVPRSPAGKGLDPRQVAAIRHAIEAGREYLARHAPEPVAAA